VVRITGSHPTGSVMRVWIPDIAKCVTFLGYNFGNNKQVKNELFTELSIYDLKVPTGAPSPWFAIVSCSVLLFLELRGK